MSDMFSILLGFWRSRRAASWRTRIDETPDLRNSEKFKNWHERPENSSLFARNDTLWGMLDEERDRPEFLALRRAALRRAHLAANRPEKTGIKIAFAAAAAALLLGVIGVANLLTPVDPIIYATGIGERRIVSLEDGSRISLDASSIVSVKPFSSHSRELTLQKGRARFDVFHDPQRPFTVTAGNETTLATGTSFDVERLNSKIFVTLRQGRVLVRPAPAVNGGHPPVALAPGQELVALRNGSTTVRTIDLQAMDAWQAGKIVLNDQPLAEAVQQFNRYRDTAITIDPAVANIRVSGVFKIEDARSFVNALTNYLPLQSRIAGNGEIKIEKRPE